MTQPVTGWRFSIDGEYSEITSKMAETAQTPIPLREEKYVFEGVRYRVLASELNYKSDDSSDIESTLIAAVHLATVTGQ